MGRNIPVRFPRVAAAFDADVARTRLCGSTESDSLRGSADLSDLVNSFMEEREEEGEQHLVGNDSYQKVSNKREMLKEIFVQGGDAKQTIIKQVQLAWRLLDLNQKSSQFKRQFMSHLRERGFDAGLCKCKWEKNTRFPAGDYEYIDVNFAGNRYIVQVSLVSEFEIARPTNQYSSLLDVFPPIFVGKLEELKQVVRLMCTAIKGSMKTMEMYIPPWRRIGYMQAKWFSAYERTTDEVVTKMTSSPFSTARSIEFDARPVKSYNCRDDYGSKPPFNVCHLTSAFCTEGPGMLL
ncbi:uncharacterized protein LOC109809184 [Cajanus cajan]|uniref:DUF506 family protein n=1 Tax=Cajanus cajan TaxID=3821 RepID=A0A151SU46_CAJCA|nr:uncharacterized protein LOC109809184 [Cajanus cajan]KYP58291.1 hypothetical protein KK1_004591 [Cajanus cajan]